MEHRREPMPPTARTTCNGWLVIATICALMLPCALAPASPAAVEITTESISSAAADELRVSPTLISIDQATPGSAHDARIRIYNRRAIPTRFTIDVIGLAGSPDPLQRVAFLERGDPADRSSARSWVTPAVRTITLQPRQVATVPIRVVVPQQARPGGHYASVLVRAAARPAGDALPGGQVGVETEMAVPLLAVVPGRVATSVAIHEVAAPGRVTSHARWSADVVLENTGDIHARPRGTVTITSLFGRVVARTSIGGRILLPDGRDRSRVTWKHAPWLGRYSITVAAHAQGAQGDTTSRTVWVLPPWWTWLVLAGLVVVWTTLNRRSRGASPRDGDDTVIGIDDDPVDTEEV